MRPVRLVTLFVPLLGLAAAACSEDEVTVESRPPLAGVRYINAVPDTGRLDFKMVDQLEYSANSNSGTGGLAFREGTEYFPTEAKARHIKVFSLADTLITTVQQVLVDTTITFEANKNYTLLLAGTARNRQARLRVIEDTPPASLGANDVAVRAYNAGAGPIDAWVVASTTTALSGTPTFSSVADLAASTYRTQAAGAFAVRVASPGTTTALASLQAAAGAAGTALQNPTAGATVPGTVFSAYIFPRSVAGSRAPQTAAFNTAGVQLFVDKLPPNTITK
jgi:hypothetical protein